MAPALDPIPIPPPSLPSPPTLPSPLNSYVASGLVMRVGRWFPVWVPGPLGGESWHCLLGTPSCVLKLFLLHHPFRGKVRFSHLRISITIGILFENSSDSCSGRRPAIDCTLTFHCTSTPLSLALPLLSNNPSPLGSDRSGLVPRWPPPPRTAAAAAGRRWPPGRSRRHSAGRIFGAECCNKSATLDCSRMGHTVCAFTDAQRRGSCRPFGQPDVTPCSVPKALPSVMESTPRCSR
mgnify:CR=1 FL=1